MTKTIEYPIEELVSIECGTYLRDMGDMVQNKIWFVRYNREHECFPQIQKKIVTKYGDDEWKNNKKGMMDFVNQTGRYCYENHFDLEGEGFGMVSSYRRELIDWSKKDVLCYSLPFYLFPRTQTGMVFSVSREFDNTPSPFYGNPHYKKYIEDNNGECPLPLPEGINWWEIPNENNQ